MKMEQKPREFESRKRYVAAVIIGTIAFLIVFAISYSLSYVELQRISNLQTGVGYDVFEDNLDYSFFGISPCNTSSFEQISEDLGFQGRIIDDLERKMGKKDENVLLRKKFYSLIEIEHFDFVNAFNQECGKKYNTILFFYSNNASEADASEESGRILGVVHNRYEKNLTIYSFDVDLASDLIDKLKNKYNITDSPVAVINEQVQVKLPANIIEIEKYLN